MRILVCGGRDYSDVETVYRVLDRVHRERGITLIIEGGQRGADALARQWAIDRGIPHETEHAEWKKYGKAAGPIRNGLMLSKHQPQGVIAFPGNVGTADMCKQAESVGLKPWKIRG